MSNASEAIKGYRNVSKKDLDMYQLEEKIDVLNSKLEKHIDFIDDTYEGLKNPIKMATRFFKK